MHKLYVGRHIILFGGLHIIKLCDGRHKKFYGGGHIKLYGGRLIIHLNGRHIILVIRFVIDLTQKYAELIKPIEGEALAPSLLWA